MVLFARPGRSVDGDDDLRDRIWECRCAFFRAHPRFFVSAFGRAVKPYRLLLPALRRP